MRAQTATDCLDSYSELETCRQVMPDLVLDLVNEQYKGVEYLMDANQLQETLVAALRNESIRVITNEKESSVLPPLKFVLTVKTLQFSKTGGGKWIGRAVIELLPQRAGQPPDMTKRTRIPCDVNFGKKKPEGDRALQYQKQVFSELVETAVPVILSELKLAGYGYQEVIVSGTAPILTSLDEAMRIAKSQALSGIFGKFCPKRISTVTRINDISEVADTTITEGTGLLLKSEILPKYTMTKDGNVCVVVHAVIRCN